MQTRLRLVFMGTPDFAVPALAALLDAGMDIACVYTQPPRPAGRGYALRKSPVQRLAEARGVPVRHPAHLKDAAAIRDFAALRADAAVVAAYGLLLPAGILEAPLLGCVNLHASLLPRWRGADPIRRAILAGDAETGITGMAMSEGLDSGDILRAEKLPVGPRMTADILHDRLAALAADMIVPLMRDWAAGRITPVPQPAHGITHAPRSGRADMRLDWTRPAASLDRLVRAFAPRGGWCPDGAGGELKILEAEPAADSTGSASQTAPGTPGMVIAADQEGPLVQCGDGLLRLLRLQRPGGKPLAAAEFQRGRGLAPGWRLQ